MKNFRFILNKINYNNNKYLLIILILLINQLLKAQDPSLELIERRIPPSPIAGELGKYGQIPVGLITGSQNLNIPLYNYIVGNLQIPLSLSYNSNGIKVDQMSTNVGLGWVLNAGGVVSRTVRDLPDEENEEVYPEKDIHKYGIYDYEAMEYFINGANDLYDSESDEYTYNINGLTGKFMFNNNNVLIKIPYTNIIIHPIGNINETGYEIIDENGIKYIFTYKETTQSHIIPGGGNFNLPAVTAWYLSKIIHPQGDTINFQYQVCDYTFISSTTEIIKKYYLGSYTCISRPCTPPGEHITSFQTLTRIMGYRLTKIWSNNPINGYITFDYTNYPEEDETVSGNFKLLQKITIFNKNNEIIERYFFNYLITTNYRVFLQNINFLDPQKKYEFQYIDPNGLCKRLSYSQDYWGYYNNKPNIHFVPYIQGGFFNNYGNREPVNSYSQKGLLNKIIYPTKGSTSIEYEANSYWGPKTICPPKVHFSLQLESSFEDEFGITVTQETDTIPFNQDIIIENPFVGYNIYDTKCETESIPTDPTAWFTIYDISVTPNIAIPFYVNSFSGWQYYGTQIEITEGMTQSFKVFFEKDKKYKCKLSVNKNCTVAGIGFYYYNEACSFIDDNIETGGSRIKKTIDFDPITNNELIKRYYYNDYEHLNKSSGDCGNIGNYFFSKKDQYLCPETPPPLETICPYYAVISSSQNSLFHQDNNNIFYRYVTVSYGGDNFENGGETHNFIINRDILGEILSGENSANVWSNVGWNHGKEKSVEYFKIENSTKILLNTEQNYYSAVCLDTIYSYSILKNYELSFIYDHHHICTEEESIKKTPRSRCNANHNHIWSLGGFFGIFIRPIFWTGCFQTPITYFPGVDCICIACGAENEFYWDYDVCYGRAGDTLVYPSSIENLNIVEYANYSFWLKLDSTVIKYFDQNGHNPLITKTYNIYNNMLHNQLSSKIVNKSDGEIITENFYYPLDYNYNNYFDTLNDKNILNTLIDYRKSINNILIKGNTFKYNKFGELTNSYIAINEIGTSLPWIYDNPYFYGVPDAFLTYNTNNRLINYRKNNKTSTSYIWGYNESNVIAVVDNSDFSESGFTSFENNEINGWEKYPLNQIINNTLISHSGTSCIKANQEYGPFRVFTVGENAYNHSSYKASVWVKGSTQAYIHIEVNGIWSTKVRQKNINGGSDWNLLEVEIPKSNYESYIGPNLKFKVYVGGDPNALFDDLRFHPSDALMSTYTYQPLVGITSESDARNIPIKYEYDEYGRLKLVRDYQGNILKIYKYNYTH